jgi:hypothetical protein
VLEKKKVLQIEPNTTYRKYEYKESAHISLIDHPISQPSVDISPIWTPITATEFRKKLQLPPVYIKWENCVFMLVHYREFVTQ